MQASNYILHVSNSAGTCQINLKTSVSYPKVFCNIFLVHITNYLFFVTLPYIDKHVCIRVFCKFKRSVIVARICLGKLLRKAQDNEKISMLFFPKYKISRWRQILIGYSNSLPPPRHHTALLMPSSNLLS